jgi:hypothetical protein
MSIKYFSDTQLADNNEAIFGTGSDLKIKHDSNNSYIRNFTGHLYIRNAADDSDIILESDDGSGGTTSYLELDGSESMIMIYKSTRMSDNHTLQIGSGADLRLTHDATHSYITNYTGNFYIDQATNDGDLILQCDDGSGGLTPYITLDGGDESVIFGKTPYIPQYILHVGDGDTYFGFATDDTFRVGVGGTQRLNIATGIELTGNTTLTGNLTTTGDITVGDDIFVADGGIINVGSSNDLNIQHDGSDNIINSNTGHLYITNYADDKDIIFRGDDGGGNIITALTLDMSDAGKALFNTRIQTSAVDVSDSNAVIYRNSNDLALITYAGYNIELDSAGDITLDAAGNDVLFKDAGTHIGTINMSNSDLSILSSVNDKDIIFKGKDGSSDITALTLDMSDAGTAIFNHDIKLADNNKAFFGGGTDLSVYHDGSNSYILHNGDTGNLVIQNSLDDTDIIFKCDDGSGGTTAYITLDGSETRTTFSKNARFNDDVFLQIGSSADLYLVHSSGDSSIVNGVGDLYIKNGADDKDIIFQADDGTGSLASYFYLDGSLGGGDGAGTVFTIFPDNARAGFGANADLRMYHDGSNSKIINLEGSLQIAQYVDDGDITFSSDDGSGGVTEYFRLDGGDVATRFSKQLVMQDNVGFSVGSGVDFTIQHNGSHSFVDNFTGDLYLRQNATDEDVFFMADDGTGNALTYFLLDGSAATHNGSFTTAVYTQWSDRSHIALGGAKDMQLYHDGSNSYIQQIDGATGDLIIEQGVDDGDMIFKSDDGSGGTSEYFRLDGGVTRTIFSAPITVGQDDTGYDVVFYGATSGRYMAWDESEDALEFTDNTKLKLGTGSDLQIYHNGSNSFIQDSGTGDLRLMSSHLKLMDASENLVLGVQAGAVAVTGTLTVGVDDTGHDVKFFGATSGRYMLWDESDDALELTDNTKIKLGDGSDLQIYHDGSNSYIDETGTGSLYIKSAGAIRLQSDTGENMIYAVNDGAVNLYHNNVKKFETTSSGIDVTGEVKGDSLDIDGNADISGTTTVGGTVLGTSAKFGRDADNLIDFTTDNQIDFRVAAGHRLRLTQTSLAPITTDSVSLGTSSLNFSDLFLDSGAVINFDNGDVTLTHSGNNLAIAGGNLEFTGYGAQFADNAKIQLGASDDLQIYHDGTNSEIDNATGDLIIKNRADDGDILFQSDDGSGGLTDYVRIDGANSVVTFSKDFKAGDNVKANFGAASDLQIYHSGSQSYIDHTGTGNLYLRTPNGQSIYLQDENGQALAQFTDGGGSFLYYNNSLKLSTTNTGIDVTGEVKGDSLDIDGNSQLDGTLTVGVDDTGHDVIFYGATSGRYLQWDESSDRLEFRDSVSAVFGNGADLHIQHDGTDSNISNNTGDLTIDNNANDKDIIFKGTDNNSDITALTLDMSDGGKATFNNDVVAFSDKKLKDNIETLDGKKVLDMRGVSFTRKDTGLPGSGVIAQEIQEVAPELVNETNGTLGVSYGNLVGYLIEAIKDQQRQIDELKKMCNGCSR